MKGRLVRAEVVLMAGLSTVFLLPQSTKISPAGISMNLPAIIGDWIGHDVGVTTKEREVLAPDTQFARKLYSNLAGDEVYVSIVMSGEDMTNSIHRPERCLPAQGWNVESSSKRLIQLPDGKSLEVTRLGTARSEGDESGAVARGLNYYWFVGYRDITASHLTRTEIDLRDRILRGYNQRWAYVTVTGDLARRFSRGTRTANETSQMLEDFIKQLVPALHRPDGTPLF